MFTPHPTQKRLLQILQQLFYHQAHSIVSRISTANLQNHTIVDLSVWTPHMVSVLKHVMLNFWQAGALDVMRNSQTLYRQTNVSFGLYGPTVTHPADQATATFCNSINSTASVELDKLRMKVLEESSNPVRDFSTNCVKMLTDPNRSLRIATTETVRAFNGGKIIAAKQASFKGKRWKVSSNPCKLCLGLQDKGTIGLDEPFIILNGGGPYSVVQFPPMHPSCQCSVEFERGETPKTQLPLQTNFRWLGY